MLDNDERSYRQTTSARRERRSRRKSVYALIFFFTILALILAGPSLVSHSSIGRSIVTRSLNDYGFEAEVDQVRMGWVTPASVSGMRLRGRAKGSQINIAKIDVDLTLMDVLKGSGSFGNVTLRDVDILCSISEGSSSIEEDLQSAIQQLGSENDSAPSLAKTEKPASATSGKIELTNLHVRVIDELTQQAWDVNQASGAIVIDGLRTTANFTGVVAEPSGRAGSLEGIVELVGVPENSTRQIDARANGENESANRPWRIDLVSESLPLSVLSVARRRLHEELGALPIVVAGDASGKVVLTSGEDGSMDASLTQFQVRNFSAKEPRSNSDESRTLWRNELATINGELSILPHHIVGRSLVASTDFAKLNFDGVTSRDFSLVGETDNPFRWLEAIDGNAQADVDLAKLQTALPGVLPLRDGAKLESGRVFASVQSNQAQSNQVQSNQRPGSARTGSISQPIPGRISNLTPSRVSKLTLNSNQVLASTHGRRVQLDPIELNATVIGDANGVRAENVVWKSAFGSAVGRGDLQSGSAEIDIDFGLLAKMVRPIIDLGETRLAGQANGKIRWDADNRNRWSLRGDGMARDLVLTVPGGQQIVQPSINGEVKAIGTWNGNALSRLADAAIMLNSDDIDLNVNLLDAVENPSLQRPIPLSVVASGDVATLAAWFRPWLPAEIGVAKGKWDLRTQVLASTDSVVLEDSTLSLVRPSLAYDGTIYTQPKMSIDLDGNARWPENQITARQITIVSDAFSAVVKGDISTTQLDCDVRWRADLNRIQQSVALRTASNDADQRINRNARNAQTVAFQTRDNATTLPASTYQYRGECEGAATVTTDQERFVISHQTSGRDVEILRDSVTQPSPEPIWFEPNVEASGVIRLDLGIGEVVSLPVSFATDWFATSMELRYQWIEGRYSVQAVGPAKIDMEQFAKRTAGIAGIDMVARGVHETDLQVVYFQDAKKKSDYKVGGSLGWDQCTIAGITFDQSTVPFLLTQKQLTIDNAVLPTGSGRLYADGVVNFDADKTWVQVNPGKVAERIELTPELTNQWLKYLAPMAADATRVQGTFSAEVDRAVIDLDHSENSQVTGRFNIASAEMSAGPLANQMFGGLNQLIALTGGRSISPNTTLLKMPPQQVDFYVGDGVVAHQRMYFEIDRAQVVTSGRVQISDTSMDMIAQIPIDARWLGRDLQGLAGQTITLPIDGTVSRPSLDSREVTKMVAELGTKAIQTTAENYLQKQLEKGLGKMFGK